MMRANKPLHVAESERHGYATRLPALEALAMPWYPFAIGEALTIHAAFALGIEQEIGSVLIGSPRLLADDAEIDAFKVAPMVRTLARMRPVFSVNRRRGQ